MTKNLVFGCSDHSKMHPSWPGNLAKSERTYSSVKIASWSNSPKSWKWPKTLFFALWIIQKGIFVNFEWSGTSDTVTKLLWIVILIKMCNMKFNRLAKLEILTLDWMDHSKIKGYLIQNSIKNQPEFSRTCGVRRNSWESLNFHFKHSKVTINDLDFRQNPLKVENPQKRPFLSTFS